MIREIYRAVFGHEPPVGMSDYSASAAIMVRVRSRREDTCDVQYRYADGTIHVDVRVGRDVWHQQLLLEDFVLQLGLGTPDGLADELARRLQTPLWSRVEELDALCKKLTRALKEYQQCATATK